MCSFDAFGFSAPQEWSHRAAFHGPPTAGLHSRGDPFHLYMRVRQLGIDRPVIGILHGGDRPPTRIAVQGSDDDPDDRPLRLIDEAPRHEGSLGGIQLYEVALFIESRSNCYLAVNPVSVRSLHRVPGKEDEAALVAFGFHPGVWFCHHRVGWDWLGQTRVREQQQGKYRQRRILRMSHR